MGATSFFYILGLIAELFRTIKRRRLEATIKNDILKRIGAQHEQKLLEAEQARRDQHHAASTSTDSELYQSDGFRRD